MTELAKNLAEQRALVAERRLGEAELRAEEAEQRAARAELEAIAALKQLTAGRGGRLGLGWQRVKSLFYRYGVDRTRKDKSQQQKKKP